MRSAIGLFDTYCGRSATWIVRSIRKCSLTITHSSNPKPKTQGRDGASEEGQGSYDGNAGGVDDVMRQPSDHIGPRRGFGGVRLEADHCGNHDERRENGEVLDGIGTGSPHPIHPRLVDGAPGPGLLIGA